MQVPEIIKNRRSMRGFEDKEIPDEQVDALLEAARWAPSAGNRQPWHFYVVRDENLKEQLVEVAYGQRFIAKAPVVFVICAEPERSAETYDDRGRNLYCLQDTAAAIQNILLTAESMGLGSCWIGAFDENECCRVLSLPNSRRPVAMIPVGYPGSKTRTPSRRPKEEIVDYL